MMAHFSMKTRAKDAFLMTEIKKPKDNKDFSLHKKVILISERKASQKQERKGFKGKNSRWHQYVKKEEGKVTSICESEKKEEVNEKRKT